MRVIAGIAKGHKLKSPRNLAIRPTSDRVKESIFNIIQNKVNESVVVDLFAGTGNLGIESLSRGARKVFFIDQSKYSIAIIKENLENVKLMAGAEVMHLDAIAAIKKLAIQNVKADLIFMDPPYFKGLIEPTLENIATYGLLNEGGLVVVEHDKGVAISDTIKHLTKFRRNQYGNTSISFYKNGEET